MPKNIHRNCPSCSKNNHEESRVFYSQDEWNIKQCKSCKFVYLENPPPYEAFVKEEAWEKNFYKAEEKRIEKSPFAARLSRATRWRMHIFPRKKISSLVEFYAPKGKVLDIGCGTGKHLKDLPEGYIPVGIEISEQLAKTSNAEFFKKGGYCINAPAHEGLKKVPDGYFSAVSMRSYLEHEINPNVVLKELKRTIAKDGVIIIKVPNFASVNRKIVGKKWCGFRFPDHVNYFTPESLKKMVEENGFRPVKFGFIEKMPTSDNMWMVARKG